MRCANLVVRSKPAFCPGDSGDVPLPPHKASVKPTAAQGSGETQPAAPAPLPGTKAHSMQAAWALPGEAWLTPTRRGWGRGGGRLPNLPVSPASDGLFHFCSVNAGFPGSTQIPPPPCQEIAKPSGEGAQL